MHEEKYIDQEVRVRLLESAILKIDDRFDKIDQKFSDTNLHIMDIMKQNFNYFLTTVGIVLALFGGMIVTKVFS